MDIVLDKNDPNAVADFVQKVAEEFRKKKSKE
jgi:ATP-dependent Clp protease adapter protein ClpS